MFVQAYTYCISPLAFYVHLRTWGRLGSGESFVKVLYKNGLYDFSGTWNGRCIASLAWTRAADGRRLAAEAAGAAASGKLVPGKSEANAMTRSCTHILCFASILSVLGLGSPGSAHAAGLLFQAISSAEEPTGA